MTGYRRTEVAIQQVRDPTPEAAPGACLEAGHLPHAQVEYGWCDRIRHKERHQCDDPEQPLGVVCQRIAKRLALVDNGLGQRILAAFRVITKSYESSDKDVYQQTGRGVAGLDRLSLLPP